MHNHRSPWEWPNRTVAYSTSCRYTIRQLIGNYGIQAATSCRKREELFRGRCYCARILWEFVAGQAETSPPGLHPTTVFPSELLMATQVLPSQLANGIEKTNGVNGKAFKSKNQQRRAKLKAKKAEQKAQPVRRVRSPHLSAQRLSFLAPRAGRHASRGTDPGV